MKKIVLILIILLVSGCSVDYNVLLNYDLSVNEKVEFRIEDSDENYEKINNLFESNNISKSNYKVTRVFDEIKIVYNKKYKNIEDYILNSVLYKQAFSEILIDKDQDKTSLKTSANFSNNNLSINKDNDLNFDYLKVSFDSKLPVISSTADKKEKNKYVWEYNGDSKEKNINITFKNRASIVTFRSILVSVLIIVSSILIYLMIRKRLKDSERI